MTELLQQVYSSYEESKKDETEALERGRKAVKDAITALHEADSALSEALYRKETIECLRKHFGEQIGRMDQAKKDQALDGQSEVEE